MSATADPAATAADALAEVMDGTRPFIEAASGLRVDLERRGFSPAHAESVAATWLAEAYRAMWRRSIDLKGDNS